MTASQPLKWPRVSLALILMVTTLLRLYQLGTEGLWVDEMHSIRDASHFDLGQSSRPLYYLLLKGWMYLGSSDTWLRSLAVLFGIGAVYLTYRLGKQCLGEFPAQIAALLMALSPLLINHAQEIRLYTLSLFLTTAGSLTLIQTLAAPSGWRLAQWGLWRLLALMTTPLNLLMIVPDTLIYGWHYRRQGRWLVAYGLTGALMALAWLPFALQLTTRSGPEFMAGWVTRQPDPGLVEVTTTLTSFTAIWPLQLVMATRLKQVYYGLYTLTIGGLLLVGLGCLWQRVRRQPVPAAVIGIGLWLGLPSLCLLLVSYVSSPLWYDRYLLMVSPYLYLLLGAGMTYLWHWKRGLAGGIAVIYAIAVSGGLWTYYTETYRSDWQGAVRLLSEVTRPGDAIIYYAPWQGAEQSLSRYYQGDAPLYSFEKPISTEQLSPALIEDTLSALPDNPPEQLWLVCWWLCDDQAEMAAIARHVMGPQATLEPVATLTNWVEPPIGIYRVPPPTAVPSVSRDTSEP